MNGFARASGTTIGLVLLTLGALNAALAMTVETCTQGDAGSLRGGVITLILYLVGAAAILLASPPRWTYLFLTPAAAIAAWHTVFALRFAWGYSVHGMSACFAMQGGFTPEEAGEWMDGSEPGLILLWLSLSIVFWLVIFVGLWRGVTSVRQS